MCPEWSTTLGHSCLSIRQTCVLIPKYLWVLLTYVTVPSLHWSPYPWLGWYLENGCCRGNLVTWTHEDGVPVRELMFIYKKKENRDILPLTCEDIARRYWPIILGFTSPTSQTMRLAFREWDSSQGRLIWSPWHPCPLVMWSPQCLSRSSYISRGWKEQRNLELVRRVPPVLLSEESIIWAEHWMYLRSGKHNVFRKSALPRYRIGPTELGMRY